jgi:hypothetical protein
MVYKLVFRDLWATEQFVRDLAGYAYDQTVETTFHDFVEFAVLLEYQNDCNRKVLCSRAS